MCNSSSDSECRAVQEVHARLVKLYPQYNIAHMSIKPRGQSQEAPSVSVGDAPRMQSAAGERTPDEAGEAEGVQCDEIVVNAAVEGDSFGWHVDADPAALPPSDWTDQHGSYCNGVTIFRPDDMICCGPI
jgi:hypothetical protein